MKAKVDHVVLKDAALLCRHCRAEYTPALPIAIPLFIGLAQAFIDTHQDCQAPAHPTDPYVSKLAKFTP